MISRNSDVSDFPSLIRDSSTNSAADTKIEDSPGLKSEKMGWQERQRREEQQRIEMEERRLKQEAERIKREKDIEKMKVDNYLKHVPDFSFLLTNQS